MQDFFFEGVFVGIAGFFSVSYLCFVGVRTEYLFSSFPSESCLFCQLMRRQAGSGSSGGSGSEKWRQIFSV
jgi:hypothetical protein